LRDDRRGLDQVVGVGDAHVLAFPHFGTAPVRIHYDNLRVDAENASRPLTSSFAASRPTSQSASRPGRTIAGVSAVLSSRARAAS
jgi:hypothetical protein